MPKNKNSKKRGGGKGSHDSTTNSLPPSRPGRNDDDESVADNWSTQSVLSDDASWPGSDPAVDEGAEEVSEQENFEDNFVECLDNTLMKSAQSRVTALKGLERALQKKYVPDFLTDRRVTVSDHLWRCLRKGKGEEQSLAATCLALLAVQLGPDGEDLFEPMYSHLLVMIADNSTSIKARGACMSALAVIAMLCCEDLEKTKSFCKALEDVFSQGYGKGENSPSVSPDMSWLMGEALAAWCLFLTTAPQFEVQTHVNRHLGPLQDLLESSDVNLRMTAGEAVALLYELARESDEDFVHESEESLCELLKQLATDSVKHRAKKDRRQQRSCFRDVQRFVVENESPSESVKLGKDNMLELTSWSQKRQYDNFCHCLLSGFSVHLKSNPTLREMFELGAPGQDEYGQNKTLSKAQRAFNNAAAFKARTKVRSKQRDKRAVPVHGY